MGAGDDVVLFSPFVANRRDPLHFFSDGAFHRACVVGHALGAEAHAWHDAARAASMPWPPHCAACGEKVAKPDDYFGTGLLACDPALAAHAFNFLHFHAQHVSGWERADELERAVAELFSSPDWEGPSWVLDRLREERSVAR